jgi:glucose/arabinose dehydrogenase
MVFRSAMALQRSQRVHPPGSAFTALLLLIALHAGAGSATVLPSGFVETQVTEGLVSPTVVSIAPDGRIFIAEQSGRVRVVRNGGLLVTPSPFRCPAFASATTLSRRSRDRSPLRASDAA